MQPQMVCIVVFLARCNQPDAELVGLASDTMLGAYEALQHEFVNDKVVDPRDAASLVSGPRSFVVRRHSPAQPCQTSLVVHTITVPNAGSDPTDLGQYSPRQMASVDRRRPHNPLRM